MRGREDGLAVVACRSWAKSSAKEGGVGSGSFESVSWDFLQRSFERVHDIKNGETYRPSSALQYTIQRLLNTSPAWLRGTSTV
jgi:hypothetical protein